MKKICMILFALSVSLSANANVLDDCIKNIIADDNIWQNMLFDKTNGVFNDLPNNADVTDEIVNEKKQKIYSLIAKDIELKCNSKIAAIAKIDRAIIPFNHNNKEYGFDFSVETMFDYINNIRTGFVIIDKRNLSSGDVLKLSDIPKSTSRFSPYHFFTDECSDHSIADNLDDDGAVNIAGQAVFNEFGGTKNEFFLDFADGNDRRAFPGLVLMDKTGSTKEKIVSYRNMKTALERYQQFGDKLKGSNCSNQGLALYLVALDVKKDESAGNTGNWSIGLVSGGGAVAAGTGIAVWAGAAAASATIPVIGWIAAGVLGATAGVVALIPEDIEDIQQVMILAGPYNL